MLTFIWAEDNQGGIGYQGRLPWHLPADLKHFKEISWGKTILMGRKTFESLPHILPGRKHLVLTRDSSWKEKYQNDERVTVFNDSKILKKYMQRSDQDICVIGGASIFALLKNEADQLERTRIHHQFNCDTFMPAIDFSDFVLVKEINKKADARNPYDYDFLTYRRKH